MLCWSGVGISTVSFSVFISPSVQPERLIDDSGATFLSDSPDSPCHPFCRIPRIPQIPRIPLRIPRATLFAGFPGFPMVTFGFPVPPFCRIPRIPRRIPHAAVCGIPRIPLTFWDSPVQQNSRKWDSPDSPVQPKRLIDDSGRDPSF